MDIGECSTLGAVDSIHNLEKTMKKSEIRWSKDQLDIQIENCDTELARACTKVHGLEMDWNALMDAKAERDYGVKLGKIAVGTGGPHTGEDKKGLRFKVVTIRPGGFIEEKRCFVSLSISALEAGCKPFLTGCCLENGKVSKRLDCFFDEWELEEKA